jgi:hypothetical protein
MDKQVLRMQMLAGLITESKYRQILEISTEELYVNEGLSSQSVAEFLLIGFGMEKDKDEAIKLFMDKNGYSGNNSGYNVELDAKNFIKRFKEEGNGEYWRAWQDAFKAYWKLKNEQKEGETDEEYLKRLDAAYEAKVSQLAK